MYLTVHIEDKWLLRIVKRSERAFCKTAIHKW